VRVLVVEDEKKLGELLGRGLREEGYAADLAARGEEALWMVRAVAYDAIVLDVMLPGVDGFEVCRRLRKDGVWTPVLMLTARDDVADRVNGLDTGADDYLTKPFSFEELLARLRALTRRAPADAASTSSLCRPRSSRCSSCSCAAQASPSRARSCSTARGILPSRAVRT
jgi:two-component system, OmpR family, response regulator